jgi:glycosyltransferase involved in cell wall biosynthesis
LYDMPICAYSRSKEKLAVNQDLSGIDGKGKRSMVIRSIVDPNKFQSHIPARCRLLYVVGQLGLGGLERQLYYLLANIDHVRYCPGVVVWNLNPNDRYYQDIQTLKVPICGFQPSQSPLSKLKALRALVRQVTPEVIHSYGFHTNFAAYYAASGTGAVTIGSVRSDFVSDKRAGGVLRGALNARWPAYHISNSRASADAARRACGYFRPKQVSVVRNALDLERFKNMNGNSQKRNYVAAVGSLLPVKRWDRLLRVIRKVKDAGRKDVHVEIAGDGPLRPILEKLAGDLNVSQNVLFQGVIDDVSAFLNGARFLVHTSESEGCPNAVMEAMACGLPVVAMEAGEIPYLVEDGETGFVVPQDDEATFVNRVSKLFVDDDLCFRMGTAARDKAQREFTLDRLVSDTLTVYRSAGWGEENVGDLRMAQGSFKQ